jgi:uncharacterized protein (DUF2164 family)
MKPITFSREETKAMVAEIQDYFQEELDQDIGSIPAEMLMRFFGDKMGAYFYNRGLYDAQALVGKKVSPTRCWRWSNRPGICADAGDDQNR